MLILQKLLIIVLVQYIINIVIAYSQLYKPATISDLRWKVSEFSWPVWVPIFGFLLQIIIIAIELFKIIRRKIRNVVLNTRIK